MDAKLFANILSDQHIINLNKLRYKYKDADMNEFVSLLSMSIYKELPIHDFGDHNLVYMDSVTQVRSMAVKLLLTPQSADAAFGLKAMEDEIASTLTIENIDFSRDSVRKILRGSAPADESENRIFGIKKGLDFIADQSNEITEENIHALYELAIAQTLPEEDRLIPGSFYRHDSVYIVGEGIEHSGLPHGKLTGHMGRLVEFINQDSSVGDLLKAAIIHFYIAFLHPYFEGNGRMARMIHLWYLIRQGYPSALFIPFSSYIERSRKGYYHAFTLVEDNAKISGKIDVTPFLCYFIEHVYHKIGDYGPTPHTLTAYQSALRSGQVTEKERDLWNFVLSAYGVGAFSTKQLERDFSNAAYATIRGFVLKFENLGILVSQKYGNRVKYSVIP